MSKIIDLSHTIVDGMVTYPGITPPKICDFLSREESKSLYSLGVTFCINEISMPANTGTYIDSPFHRFKEGIDLSQIPLDSVVNLEIVVCKTIKNNREIGVNYFKELDITGKAVLIDTGWSKHWGSEQYNYGHPYLTKEAASFLQKKKAALVGIDSLNIDDTDDPSRPVHTILLGSNIPIIEHMCNLQEIPESKAMLHAAPIKIHQFGTFPVRVYAIIEK